MDITELEKRIDHYRAQEAEVIARQRLATTHTQRFELERMLRFIQVTIMGLLDSTKRELSRDHTGRVERPAVRSQAVA